MYREWREHRNTLPNLQTITCDIDEKETLSKDSVSYAVRRFITEVKKLDGNEYPGRTLYDIVICLQFHFELLGFAWKLLNNDDFKEICFTLDNLMKLRTSQGIGISVKKHKSCQILMKICCGV